MLILMIPENEPLKNCRKKL